MDLPPRLRKAIDAALEGVPLSDLASASDALSRRYRSEVRDGRLHISDERAALAYLATRMPATYAAIHAGFRAAAELLPAFSPVTALDAGAGPGTALWAARSCWPTITDAELVEASAPIRAWGEKLSAESGIGNVAWRAGDLPGNSGGPPRDLVMLAYVLDELAPPDRDALIGRLWARTSGVLVIVEPGTPAGWQRILAARSQLIDAGAHIVAPCPHHAACPLAAPDWCHFSARLARSRMHRLAKGGDVPWEDEKFIYLAASRLGPAGRHARILAPPQTASGRVRLKLCQPDGTVSHRLITRREGDAYKAARRSDWGDMLRVAGDRD